MQPPSDERIPTWEFWVDINKDCGLVIFLPHEMWILDLEQKGLDCPPCLLIALNLFILTISSVCRQHALSLELSFSAVVWVIMNSVQASVSLRPWQTVAFQISALLLNQGQSVGPGGLKTNTFAGEQLKSSTQTLASMKNEHGCTLLPQNQSTGSSKI